MSVLVGIEEVLVRLKDRGPQSTNAVAQAFGLKPLDARILLLDAHLHGLVIRNDWGEWAISSRGREALATGHESLGSRPRVTVARTSTRSHSDIWQRVPRRSIAVGASAVVCGLAAGVAIGFVNSAGGPAPSPVNQRSERFLAAHGRHFVRGRVRSTRGSASTARRFQRTFIAARQLRSFPRTSLRRSYASAIFEPRLGRGTATARSTLRMASRAVQGKAAGSCGALSATRSSGRRVTTHQHSTSSRCSTSSRSNRSSRSNSPR